MAYSQAWTDNDPVGTDPAKLAWQEMQQIRKDIRERLLTIFTMPDFTSDPLRVGTLNLGYTGATGNAFVNLSNYQGNLQWQFGILQRTSETTLTLRNAILAADAISVAAANNRVTILSGLTITTGGLTISAGDLALAASATNVQLSLSSVGGSGRNYGWISRTTGDFALRDISAGADRVTISAGGNVTMSAALALGATLSILGDTNKVLSGNATDFTIINDNATGTIKLRTNGATRFTLDASGNIVTTGNLTLANGLDINAGGLSVTGTTNFANGFTVNASGIAVTGASTFNSQLTVVGTAGFNSLVTVNAGLNTPTGSWQQFGTNPATAGFIRLPNSAAITWRNAANSANIAALYLNSSDNVQVAVDLSVAGHLDWTGIATGNGSGLNTLNAGSLSAGTLPAARVAGGTYTVSAFTTTTLTVSGVATFKWIDGSGSAPTLSSIDLGVGGTASVVAGSTDLSGRIDFTFGSSGFLTGNTLFNLIPNVSWPGIPIVVVSYRNGPSGIAYPVLRAFGLSSANISISAASSPVFSATNSYSLYYHIIGFL